MRATPDLLQDLAARIRAIESATAPRGPTAGALSLPFLDTLLAPAGLSAGSLVELLSTTDGAGAWTLGLYWARHACMISSPLSPSPQPLSPRGRGVGGEGRFRAKAGPLTPNPSPQRGEGQG
jgi:hypothetical protein